MIEYIKQQKLIFLIFCLLSFPLISHADSAKVKILPLGDSITCASKYKLSYRYPLWQKLVDAGKQIQFIGSHAAKGDFGRSKWKPHKGQHFPTSHECHSGWRADQILEGLSNNGNNLSQWLKRYTPDIALVHLGTNDLYQSQTPESTRDDIEKIIIKLLGNNPRIKILLAKIIPLRMDKSVYQLNHLIGQLVKKLNKPASPIMSVDMYSGFSVNTDMQKDQIHPNASGERKMAQRWFKALMQQGVLESKQAKKQQKKQILF